MCLFDTIRHNVTIFDKIILKYQPNKRFVYNKCLTYRKTHSIRLKMSIYFDDIFFTAAAVFAALQSYKKLVGRPEP